MPRQRIESVTLDKRVRENVEIPVVLSLLLEIQMLPGWRKRAESYRGLKMACAPGVHEAGMQLLRSNSNPGTSAIDLGACTGAFLARLREYGYDDLHGVEYDGARIELADVATHSIDLNTDFSDQLPQDFDLVVCTEVIEHLDSTRHCLQHIHALLKPDGLLLLSLPNIEHWKGRIKFLMSGAHWGFGESHYRNMRHISPVTDCQMKLVLSEIGFELVDEATSGSFCGPTQTAALLPIWGPLRVLFGPRTLGDSAIYLARKHLPNEELRTAKIPA